MGTVPKEPDADELSDKELLERPESPEEREALEKLDRDAERLLEEALKRAGPDALRIGKK
jgi:hypothetical protein